MIQKIPIREFVLKNGLRILVCERHSHPVVCCMIWYRVGSRNEGAGETGLSHFLEHMMFKGTPKYAKGEIDRMTAQLGGSNNAFTNTDYTAYYFNFASDRWRVALDIEAERMRRCLMDGKEFEAEKKVVLEELKMGKDDPWRDLYQELQSTAYSVHPYHHPVIGWESELHKQTRERMFSYYKKYYSPDQAVLVIAGDVKPQEVFKEAKRRFASIPRQKEQANIPILPEPDQRGERRIILRRATNISRFAVAYKTCRVGENDDDALDLLSTILSFGKSARLYRKLVHPGIAVHATSENDPRLDPGMFWVGVELTHGQSQEKVEQLILRELEENLTKKLVSATELKKAKRILASSFHFHQESISDLAEQIGRWEIQASHRLINGYVQRIQKISAKKIREIAQKYFRPECRNIGWSVPEKEFSKKKRGSA